VSDLNFYRLIAPLMVSKQTQYNTETYNSQKVNLW